MSRRGTQLTTQVAIAALLGFGGMLAVGTGWDSLPAMASSLVAQASGSCNIKGNISINSGERIYHVPGQRYYGETKIRSEYGERWFCSEPEARQAGWRRAGQ